MTTADIVVVDGMSRSGTTLLSSILHSQDRMACYRGIFPEMLAMHLGHWPNGTLTAETVPATAAIEVKDASVPDQSYQFARQSLVLYWQTLKATTLRTIEENNQTDGLSLKQWHELLADAPKSIKELDALYQKVASKRDVELLALRWNQGIATLPFWKSRPRHKWVCCIRNPMDRACSAEKIWQKGHEKSIGAFEVFAGRIEAMWSQIDSIVFYEDLVTRPQEVVGQLLSDLGHPRSFVEVVDLRHQDGGQYRNEKADLVDTVGSHKIGEQFSGFYDQSIGRYRREMDESLIDSYCRIMEKFPFLHRYLEVYVP